MGPQGPQGEQGPPGPVGPAGSDGSIIHAGDGVPDENTGKPGDFYLDLTSGNLFGPKMAEGWGVPTNLQGPEGPQGEQGPQGPEGPAGEDGSDGQDGQDGEQGPQGPAGEDGQDGTDGKDGSQIFAGNGAPDDGLGKKDDYYLDRDNYDLYGPKTGSGWGTPINLQGPKGDQGPEGPAGTTNHSELDNLNADDHTQYLLANGVRNSANGFAVTGAYTGAGPIPVEGEGARLLWHPGKTAFRAGIVNGNQWDNAQMGAVSVAMGHNTTASGLNSTALGQETTASGSYSTALGVNTNASGGYSTTLGIGTTASGLYTTAMGNGSTANGINSTAMGAFTTAETSSSLSIGLWNSSNTTNDNTLFVAGNGTSLGNESDALVLDFNGNMTIAGTLTQNSDRRLKTDIRPLKQGILGKLDQIHPVRYRFKDTRSHPSGEQIGLIAQEVQAQFPEMVSEASNGTLSLSYSKFTTVLLKGVQEQQAEIEKQRVEIEQLQAKANRVDKLEARLAKLEQQRLAYTTELTGFADAGHGAKNRWMIGGLLLAVCCIILWRLLKSGQSVRL